MNRRNFLKMFSVIFAGLITRLFPMPPAARQDSFYQSIDMAAQEPYGARLWGKNTRILLHDTKTGKWVDLTDDVMSISFTTEWGSACSSSIRFSGNMWVPTGDYPCLSMDKNSAS